MYRHTQVGWVMIGVFGVMTVLFGAIALVLASQGEGAPSLLLPLIPLLILLLAPSLTVTVDDEAVEARFGIGLIRKRFPLAEIATCEPVRNPWWWGWGVKLIWGSGGATGWMYNVSGLEAVELRMRDGRLYRIGTDEPDALARAIGDRLRDARRAGGPPGSDGT